MHVLFVTRLENFKMDVFFVTFDRGGSRSNHAESEGGIVEGGILCLLVHAGHVPPLRILFERQGMEWGGRGKRKKGEREGTREDLGAWSTVYRYHVSLSLSLSPSTLRYSTTIARANTMETNSLSETRALTITPSSIWPTSLRFSNVHCAVGVRVYQMCLLRWFLRIWG